MALFVILGLWLILGRSIYRAQGRARSITAHPTPGEADGARGHRHLRADIPDTVPSEWIEAYRAEHGG
jgi:hypothetical protein